MEQKLLFNCLFSFACLFANAQTYDDHFGNGNTVGIIITSSSNIDTVDVIENVLTGEGNWPDEAGAARFLHQATFGATYSEIQYVTSVGIEAWIDEQTDIPLSTYYDNYLDQLAIGDSIFGGDFSRDTRFWFNSWSFYDKLFTDSDQLRQKVFYALNQIFVISYLAGDFDNESDETTFYMDHLYKGAFGNFRDILEDVTYDAKMGEYLTYFENSATDYSTNIQPDENYAREIMQLFTIGLWELNNDGTHKKDASGNSIPTYDNDDITEMAKVFTGLRNNGDFVPMVMDEFFHDNSPKKMIDGTTLPANQSGTEDLRYVLDMLFNHPNTAPFIAIRLIQHMVKSNPTPAYVNRVAKAFSNNGNGVRGDMKAVVKAVLLDPEARDCAWIDHPSAGRLLSRSEREMLLWKTLDVKTPTERYFYLDSHDGHDEQQILRAPSVFNWYSPLYAEPNIVAAEGMVSPEFEIFNSITSIQYINKMEDAVRNNYPFPNRTTRYGAELRENLNDKPYFDEYPALETIYNNSGTIGLIDHLDLILCRNNLGAASKSIILNALNQFASINANYTAEDAVKDALYLILTTPDFNILK